MKGFLHDPGTGNLDFPIVQFARPGRDALEVIRSNHDRIDRRVLHQFICCTATEVQPGEIYRRIVRQMTFQTIAFPYGGPPRPVWPMAR